MSAPIGRPPGSIDPERPDAGFNDDHVGGHAKLDEERAQRIRQSAGRYITPKRIQTEAKQISGPAAFRAPYREAAADALERDAKRRIAARGEAAQPQQQAQPPVRRDARMVRLERIEQRLTLLLGTMVRVQRQLTALDESMGAEVESVDDDVLAALLEEDALDEDGDRGGEPQQHDAPEDPHVAADSEQDEEAPIATQLARRLVLLEQAAKFQLQLLIGGGQGLTLMNDPLLTFERLFDQIADWPKSVKPGFRPTNAAEVDIFLAWVFEPAGEPGDAELLRELSGL